MVVPSSSGSKVFDYLAVVFGVLAVGAIDHVTGSNIHVVSLYFIPLAFAGWRLGRLGAAIVSLLSALVWLIALYTSISTILRMPTIHSDMRGATLCFETPAA